MAFFDLFKRAKKIREARKRADEPIKQAPGPFDLGPGDVIEAAYENFQIIGRAEYGDHDLALTLRSGDNIKFLYLTEGVDIHFAFYDLIDGRLESRHEVPDEMILDGTKYYCESDFDMRIVEAYEKTRFGRGAVHIWKYRSDQDDLLQIEWSYDTEEFAIYQGRHLDQSEVKIIVQREG